MSIKVTYKIACKTDYKLDDITDLILKDSSWGSFPEEFYSAVKSIQNYNKTNSSTIKTDWRDIQPTFEVLDRSSGIVQITYKEHQFSMVDEGVDHFLGTIAGDIVKSNGIQTLEIIDLDFSKLENNNRTVFQGPKTNIKELYEFFGNTVHGEKRPLICFSLKPRIGLGPEAYSVLLDEASKAEIDLIEDDERLVDPTYLSFEDRVNIISKKVNCTKTKFSINITGNQFTLGTNKTIQEKFNLAYDAGIRVFKIDVLVVGFNTLCYLRMLANSKPEPVFITVFPDIYGQHRSLSRQATLKLARLCGADIIYAKSPNVSSRIDGTLDADIKSSFKEVHMLHRILMSSEDEWSKVNQTLPTMTHDFHSMTIEAMIYYMRCLHNDHYEYAFFVGGGISSLPNVSVYDVCLHLKEVISFASNQDLSKIDYQVTRLNELKGFKYGIFESLYNKIGLYGLRYV